MSQIKSNTSVTNQVKLLAEKLTENSESESLLTPTQIANYLELQQAYLNEVREAYPGAAAGSAYQAV
jgi:hypothetical protein